MKKNREDEIKRELISRGTLPTMPSATELRSRAKDRSPMLTIYEQSTIEGYLLSFKSAKREAYRATQRKYRFPDSLRLAVVRIKRLADGCGEDEDREAASKLDDFFKNPSGVVKVDKIQEAEEMRIACQICLDALASACEEAFTIKADAIAKDAARCLQAVFDTAKGRKDALRQAIEKLSLAADRWLIAQPPEQKRKPTDEKDAKALEQFLKKKRRDDGDSQGLIGRAFVEEFAYFLAKSRGCAIPESRDIQPSILKEAKRLLKNEAQRRRC